MNRKLSPWRLLLAIVLLALAAYASYIGVHRWQDMQQTETIKPWFAPYVDVTATPRYAFEQLGSTPIKNIILSFIVAQPEDPCTPSWGGHYTMDEASSELDLDRRIARFRQQGGNVIISFGGLLNQELATACTDTTVLAQAYQSVITRYQLDTIDLDLEGNNLTNQESLNRIAQVMAELQANYQSQGHSLAIWLTLPVAPQGLTQDGTYAVSKMLSAGVDLAGLNVMTMDYGASKESHQSMQLTSQQALLATHHQLGILYQQAGINLNSYSIWKKLGATPMIGQNDILGEIFTLQDAKAFNSFALTNGLARMSMWSANRDVQCGENYVNTAVVSDSCSGVEQSQDNFMTTLGNQFKATANENASQTTTSDAQQIVVDDDPDQSPYQVWKENGTYLQGTKVVWHHNVYQAKWWTQGDLPDNPVLQAWQTPWQLIGPVLPGEKPIPEPTLPPGTYPEWQGPTIYEAGQRVLFHGVPYQAKWWTQGDSPAASSSSQDSSPWIILNQHQIDALIKELNIATESAN